LGKASPIEAPPDPVVRALLGYREAIRVFLDERDRQRSKPTIVGPDGSDPNAEARARVDLGLKTSGKALFDALVDDLNGGP
jgi:hypothetical protein